MSPTEYTDDALAAASCVHCGAPAEEQWMLNPCPIGEPAWHALCLDCDIDLNRIVMGFLRLPDAADRLARYIERKKPCP